MMAVVQTTLDLDRISVLRSRSEIRRSPDTYHAVAALSDREIRPAVSVGAVLVGALVVIVLLATSAPDLLITPGVVGLVSWRLVRSRRGLHDIL